MRAGRRKLDMLPLLDVFMVILFVFATIQEGRLDETTQEAREASERLATAEAMAESLQATIAQAHIEERQAELQNTRDALASERDIAARLERELAEVKQERETLQQTNTQTQARLEEVQDNAEAAMQVAFPSDDQYRQQDILERLLDQNSVFEVEVRGDLTFGGIVNYCCYRADPRGDSWQSCGVIPEQVEERDDWFRRDAHGLLRTLRQTKGGNAITIIRQDAKATYRIGTKLESLIRAQVAEQKVYNEGIRMITVRCKPE